MGLEHERQTLPGGTVVLTRPLHGNDIVVVRAFTPMGPLYESVDDAGISNILQNLLPRGTRHRTARELQEALAGMGAELDVSTGLDLGSVDIRATSDRWEPAIELFLEALTQPALDEEELEIEREQTLGELEAREDQLLVRAWDLFRERFYGDHPASKRVPGYRDTVERFDRQKVVEAAARFYDPVPRIVVAVGRFEPDRLLSLLDAAFGGTALGSPISRPAPARPGHGTNRLELDRDAAYLIHGYPAPDYDDAEYPVTRVVNAMLGGSMSSRLFQELREKRALAYQVSSTFGARSDSSFLAAYIVTEPAAEAEIEAARKYLRGRYLIEAETNGAQAGRLARYEAYGLGKDFGDRWLDAIDRVTAQDVMELGRRYFTVEPARAIIVPRNSSEF
jgi:predicted Zn-dependent peptidase